MDKTAIRKQRTEVFVGLFVFFGLAIMGTLILQFGRFSDRVRGSYVLNVEFADSAGLRNLSPVKMGGQRIGFVKGDPELKDNFSAVDVKLAIYEDQKIPTGSSFQIGTSGLMGDTFVEVVIAENFTGKFFQDGTKIDGTTAADIADLQEDAGVILEEIKIAVTEIQTAVKSLNRVFEKVEGDVLGEENVGNIQTTLAELKTSSENIRGATEKLDPTMDDIRLTIAEAKTAMTKAGTTFDTATETIEGIQETVAKADPAIAELQPTVVELRKTIQTANETLEKIQSGDGVAGALISDSGMREDLQSFADKLEAYGILGYPKDKKEKSGGLLFGDREKRKELKAEESEGTNTDRPANNRPSIFRRK